MSEENSDLEGNVDDDKLIDDVGQGEYLEIPRFVNDESDGSSHLTASDDVTSWITWFISLRGHDFFFVKLMRILFRTTSISLVWSLWYHTITMP